MELFRRKQVVTVTTIGAVPDTRTLTAGAGLTGGGTLAADRTFDVGAGAGITVNANDVALTIPVTVARGGTNATSASGTALDNITGFASTGIMVRTGAGTYAFRTMAQPSEGITITNGDGVSGSPTFALANDLAALEGLSGQGIAVRTAANTWAQRQVAAPAAGITVTNPFGIAGDITLVLANDLASLEALSGTNTIYYRSGTDTWSAVTIGGMLSFSAGTLNIGDAELTAIAGLASAANTKPYFTGSGTAALSTYYHSWASSTLTWTQSTTPPTVGNATVTGIARRIGNHNWVKGTVIIGSTTTVGTGTFLVSFASPFDGANSGGIDAYGAAAFYDLSADKLYMGAVVLSAGATQLRFYVSDPAGSTPVSQTVPFTWANGDRLWFADDYPAS